MAMASSALHRDSQRDPRVAWFSHARITEGIASPPSGQALELMARGALS